MGCSTSKLDDEEAVQLCKDRKRFIKQAMEQRIKFASGHIAYVESLRRVSAALRDYIEGDEPREFFFDSCITPPFTLIKKASPGFIALSGESFSLPPPTQSHTRSTFKVNYLRSGGNPSVAVEERPQSPETCRVEVFSPIHHHYGIDGFFAMQSSPMNSTTFFSSSPNNRPNLPPPSPQTSQWDFFWNPFSSLDNYGYPMSSLDHTFIDVDDEFSGLRQVREEEGIPDLEEDEYEREQVYGDFPATEERTKFNSHSTSEEVIVEDVDEDEEDDDEFETDSGTDNEHEMNVLRSHGSGSIEISKAKNVVQVGVHKIHNQQVAVGEEEAKEEPPGFTVYVKRRPTSMVEVLKDLEEHFTIICDSANEVSTMMEASRAKYAATSNELSAMKMLNPVALIRSASSRSTLSTFLMNSSGSKDEGYESNSDFSDETCMLSGGHQSTLDRLYAWEKKLYEEVRSGERFRTAYEKKCVQLRKQDVKGEDPTTVDKTRAAIRDLHTQIKVSIHSVEAVSKRIENLRDEELQPQLFELIQGLTRMWKVMAECHQSQKRTLDEAKILLAGTPSKLAEDKKHTIMSSTETHRLARSATNLETELRNWRGCFATWITSQRSYIRALTGWLLRCVRPEPGSLKLPFSPRHSGGAPPIFGLCIQWSKFLDVIRETPVLEGLDFFSAGVGSLYAQQLREDSRRTPGGSKRLGSGFSDESGRNMEIVEAGQIEEEFMMTAEKMAEVAIRVLCAGMYVAMSSLSEFSIASADGYADMVSQWLHGSDEAGK
ncbi:protein of unknown function DUF630 [Dillenia turbinata]|uniref:DUF632 domain-containing protein n=1 Tax=Dillenia turbinata TaxID=194707 RepID=A0AAN8ZKS3_9MAGN